MTKEERDLLFLKDLCARLPYDVRVAYNGDLDAKWYSIESIDSTDNEAYISTLGPHYTSKYVNLRYIKPYLRPMSSMTEREKKEYKLICASLMLDMGNDAAVILVDWLNKHHFDYRGLIEKKLAIDCTNLNIY